MEQNTGRQVVRAWTIFVGTSVAWVLILYGLSLLMPQGSEGIPLGLHFLVFFVLCLILFVALLVSIIWLSQKLRRLVTFAFSKNPNHEVC